MPPVPVKQRSLHAQCARFVIEAQHFGVFRLFRLPQPGTWRTSGLALRGFVLRLPFAEAESCVRLLKGRQSWRLTPLQHRLPILEALVKEMTTLAFFLGLEAGPVLVYDPGGGLMGDI